MLLTNFNGKEHLRHRAVSLRQHGFLVYLFQSDRSSGYIVCHVVLTINHWNYRQLFNKKNNNTGVYAFAALFQWLLNGIFRYVSQTLKHTYSRLAAVLLEYRIKIHKVRFHCICLIVFVSVCQSVCLSVYHYTVRTAWVANKLHHKYT